MPMPGVITSEKHKQARGWTRPDALQGKILYPPSQRAKSVFKPPVSALT